MFVWLLSPLNLHALEHISNGDDVFATRKDTILLNGDSEAFNFLLVCLFSLVNNIPGKNVSHSGSIMKGRVSTDKGLTCGIDVHDEYVRLLCVLSANGRRNGSPGLCSPASFTASHSRRFDTGNCNSQNG